MMYTFDKIYSNKKMQRFAVGYKFHRNRKFCPDCDGRFCTYDSHIQMATEEHPHILGNKDQFCEALFHVFKSPEMNIQARTIHGKRKDKCRFQTVTLIMRLVYDNQECVMRFTNCRRVHAEQMLIENRYLATLLESLQPKPKFPRKMFLYCKYQPCHHSAGNLSIFPEGYRFNDHADTRSCSELLVEFAERLVQYNIEVQVQFGTLYKANWEAAIHPDDVATVQNAMDGIKLLQSCKNITICAMRPDDWQWLSTLCSNVRFEDVLVEERLKTDEGNDVFLQGTRKRKLSPADLEK